MAAALSDVFGRLLATVSNDRRAGHDRQLGTAPPARRLGAARGGAGQDARRRAPGRWHVLAAGLRRAAPGSSSRPCGPRSRPARLSPSRSSSCPRTSPATSTCSGVRWAGALRRGPASSTSPGASSGDSLPRPGRRHRVLRRGRGRRRHGRPLPGHGPGAEPDRDRPAGGGNERTDARCRSALRARRGRRRPRGDPPHERRGRPWPSISGRSRSSTARPWPSWATSRSCQPGVSAVNVPGALARAEERSSGGPASWPERGRPAPARTGRAGGSSAPTPTASSAASGSWGSSWPCSATRSTTSASTSGSVGASIPGRPGTRCSSWATGPSPSSACSSSSSA
ncbi:MAG: hypothetical protein MZV64_33585 [Ignavibacteriales bacterium]|nr:hypothetical protein [Ignavibacteriales bacterium]